MERTILIGGEAGQGLVTVGQLLSKALVRSGYEILVSQSYYSRIRGGHNTFSIRAGNEKILGPTDKIDLLVALNEETVELHLEQLLDSGLLVVDAGAPSEDARTLRIPYKEFAPEKLYNTVALGVLGKLLGLKLDVLTRGIEDLIGKKHPEALTENLEVLEKSYAWTAAEKPEAFEDLPPVPSVDRKIMVNGNEAIGLGAMAAGVRFCSFYPMTPSTSVALTLIAHADAMGCVVEQAEDEIAAVNMAIGASFAGVPSIVTTSGGGYALMTEGISLAGMTETPLLVVVAQRPGPATGLPTRTEQGDLNFVLHGGHGEFAKAIFAPGSVESCFTLAEKAVTIAEQYQTPVFLLTDQFLADSYRAVEPFAIDKSVDRHPGCERPGGGEAGYVRYQITEEGISPRLLPGFSEDLVVADSDEHTPDGHITEDLNVRIQMVDKRLRKLEGLRSEFLLPVYDGSANPDLVMVCWGSSMGPVLEAATRKAEEGMAVATLCFEQVWPLSPDAFMQYLTNASRVICVEGNATGQFAGLLRRETGFAVHDMVLRYDGLPFTADYILDRL